MRFNHCITARRGFQDRKTISLEPTFLKFADFIAEFNIFGTTKFLILAFSRDIIKMYKIGPRERFGKRKR